MNVPRACFWFGVAAFCLAILGWEGGYSLGSWLWVFGFLWWTVGGLLKLVRESWRDVRP